jgi:hypothetical protein
MLREIEVAQMYFDRYAERLIPTKVTVGICKLKLLLNGVTLTAKISLASLTPTGTVTFLDGTTPLGSATLTNGTAVLSTSSFAAGSHSITVAYGGDGNFVATTSAALMEVAADFSLAPTSGNNGVSATVQPGGTAAFSLTFTPTNASTWPATVTLSASGLPAGASVTFSPANAGGRLEHDCGHHDSAGSASGSTAIARRSAPPCCANCHGAVALTVRRRTAAFVCRAWPSQVTQGLASCYQSWPERRERYLRPRVVPNVGNVAIL